MAAVGHGSWLRIVSYSSNTSSGTMVICIYLGAVERRNVSENSVKAIDLSVYLPVGLK